MLAHKIKIVALLVICFCLLPIDQAHSQDVEPRRWTPLPIGVNVIGVGYAYSTGDIAFDPVLLVEDATVDMDTFVVSYARTFALFGRSARFDAIVPWQHGTWQGLLDGAPASATRTGLADPKFRLSINLYGAPAESMDDFKKRAASQSVNTVIGAAIAVTVPLGEYFSDKLLNLGNNRYVFRPQIGVLHTRGLWSYELTGSTFRFSDNDDFFGGSTLEQDPLYALQAHVIRVFDKTGYWVALSTGYGWKGDTVVDGVRSNNTQKRWLSSLAFGIPVGKKQGIKFAYLRDRTKTNNGSDVDSLAIGWSIVF